jgi:ornithine cyclodeaminase/alanine dehydrogenase-like protein (mu-crystallin family)
MAAAAPGLGVMGLKAYAVSQNAQPRFHVHLSDADTGELLAIIEASRLGQVRTGAASGVATRHMARKDAYTVGIIGSGYQAQTQLEAICRVREIRAARVFSRTPEHRERFASEMSVRLGIAVTAADSAEVCVRGSDIVVTVTSSSTPVLSGEWLSPGAHVNAAGANHWLRRELDDGAVRRANVVVADDVEQARLECGDLIYPIERGILRWEQVHSLSDVIAGRAMGRANEGDITLFESQGLALEDIAVGIRVYRLARERGIGRELPF